MKQRRLGLSSSEVDSIKRVIELRQNIKFRKIFSNMAQDMANLYQAEGSINAKALAENYRPEFLKEVRDTMRIVVKRLSFNMRQSIENITRKNVYFDLTARLFEIDNDFIEVKRDNKLNTKENQEKVDEINTAFLLAVSLFIANESEKQVDFITETNERAVNTAILAGGVAVQNQINRFTDDGRSISAEALEKNRRVAISKIAKEDFKYTSVTRSRLISEQIVGMTESYTRQKEAELLNDSKLSLDRNVLSMKKSWNAILDKRTRPAHAAADGQIAKIKDPFLVGGEYLQMPRDPIGSAGNIIRCRCNAEYFAL